MSVKIENVDLVLGAPTEATITKLPSSLVNKAFGFFLTEIKNGDDIIVEFDKPKQMVPSFDKLKSDSVLILQYSNAEPEVPATIALVLELDFNEGTVKMTGHGFTSAGLSVETEEVDRRLNLAQANLEKKILEEWDKVKNDLKETTFEHFKEVYSASFWYDGANVDTQKVVEEINSENAEDIQNDPGEDLGK